MKIKIIENIVDRFPHVGQNVAIQYGTQLGKPIDIISTLFSDMFNEYKDGNMNYINSYRSHRTK